MNKTKIDVSEWNKIATSLSFRADGLNSATDVFVDTIFVDTLKAKQNQIIYGRRGTGKTHLLKRLEEEYISKFEQYRVIPIFVNGSKLRRQANITVEIPQAIALSLYIEFIKTLIDRLHEFINSQLDASFWDQLRGGKQSKTAQKAQSIANEMYNLLTKGEVRFLPSGNASEEIQRINETVEKVAAGTKINIADPRKLGWMLSLESGLGKSEGESEVILTNIKGQIILPFSEVAEKVQELLALLDSASLVILFDEWSDLDDKLDTQPYLADMIKRTFSAITQMYVKLACVPIRTLLSTQITSKNPIPVGYEEGDDISADVDLDSVIFVQNDINQFFPFFMILLKKHMGISLEVIGSMEMSEFEEYLFDNIFEGVNVFSELCQASAGVPRDFLTIFRKATTMQISKGDSRINLAHIREASLKLRESKMKSFDANSPEIKILDRIYKTIIAKNNIYFFLLKEENSRNSIIQMLWARRLIHRMPAKYYDSETFTRYIYYMMDYGECVDLLRARAYKLGVEKGRVMADVIPNFECYGWLASSLSSVAKYSLPILMGNVESRRILRDEPAGNLEFQPEDIIFDDSIFYI